MKVSEIIDNVRFDIKVSTDDYSDLQMISHLNQLRKEAQMMILRSQGYQSDGIDALTTSLVKASTAVAGTIGHNGEYPLDLSIVSVKRIELMMKSTSDYVEAMIYRITDNKASEFDNLDSTFSESEPKVKLMRNSLFIRPLPTEAINNGLRIICAISDTPYYDTSANEVVYGAISNTDDTDTVLNEAFHNWYVKKLGLKYFSREPEKFNQLIASELEQIQDSIDDSYSIKVSAPLSMTPIQHSFK
jgi:hypothetical protein